jgi:hypothetical protein
VKLTLTPNDFKDFRSFERAMKKAFGELTYVGTDSMVIHVDYPKELKAMLRPYGAEKQADVFDFDLKLGA